jgi:phytoene dehydrogenase-like protein
LNSRAHYDVAIIGAGLSGLAAGVRLAHFGKRVCIFECHNAPGGLNSFYSIAGRKYDVGLHAMTNYVRPGVKGTPLGTLFRQLRISRDELVLCEQRRSRIAFGPRGETALCFTNDFTFFESEVDRAFPAQIDGFRRLTQLVRDTAYSPESEPVSARSILRGHITDPLLEDMLLCPVLMYGGAQEHDVDFRLFALLFRAILLEGLARPFEGIRPLLRLLLDKYRGAGGERRMKCGVRRILARGGRAEALVLESGESITADQVLSSIGGPETAALIGAAPGAEEPVKAGSPPPGAITFVETVTLLDREPAALGWGDDTIVFFNDSDRLDFARPEGQVDVRSGVVCIPNNFDHGPDRRLPEGVVRATCLANYDLWAGLPEDAYRADKRRWFDAIRDGVRRFLPPVEEGALAGATVATDMFTPRTVAKFTRRLKGAIYGSGVKSLDGRTALDNVHLCGADQGLIGIVGAMLSGITMANEHILRKQSHGL